MIISKAVKEIIRYVIIAMIMVHVATLSNEAYGLELEGKLTMQFAGIVASAYAVLTLVLKFIFHSEVAKDD